METTSCARRSVEIEMWDNIDVSNADVLAADHADVLGADHACILPDDADTLAADKEDVMTAYNYNASGEDGIRQDTSVCYICPSSICGPITTPT